MPPTILIVDDERTTRIGLAELLKQAGYGTITAETFEEGVGVLRTTAPDLLVTDVRLGSFNGLQLMISSPRPVPTIVITGFADPVLESDARRRGAEYLLKPIDPAELLSVVELKLQAAKEGFGIPRRWERKPVIGGLKAQIDGEPARVLDVSYGGIRVEIPGEPDRTPPSSFRLTFPAAQLSVQATLVWKSLIAGRTWLIGAALSPESAESGEWPGFVDAVA